MQLQLRNIEERSNTAVLDTTMNMLCQDMDRFIDEFRKVVCFKYGYHNAKHRNVKLSPSGKEYCDNMIEARARKFRKQNMAFLFTIARQARSRAF